MKNIPWKFEFFIMTSFLSAFQSDSDSSWLALSFSDFPIFISEGMSLMQDFRVFKQRIHQTSEETTLSFIEVKKSSINNRFWSGSFWLWFLHLINWSPSELISGLRVWADFQIRALISFSFLLKTPLLLDHSSDIWNAFTDYRYS